MSSSVSKSIALNCDKDAPSKTSIRKHFRLEKISSEPSPPETTNALLNSSDLAAPALAPEKQNGSFRTLNVHQDRRSHIDRLRKPPKRRIRSRTVSNGHNLHLFHKNSRFPTTVAYVASPRKRVSSPTHSSLFPTSPPRRAPTMLRTLSRSNRPPISSARSTQLPYETEGPPFCFDVTNVKSTLQTCVENARRCIGACRLSALEFALGGNSEMCQIFRPYVCPKKNPCTPCVCANTRQGITPNELVSIWARTILDASTSVRDRAQAILLPTSSPK